jgi:hypothetical protein
MRRQRICLWAAVIVCLFASVGRAQSVTPEDEFRQLLRVNQEIAPLGATPFGESVSLYNGELSFSQTDVISAGNGLPIELGRELNLQGRERASFRFADSSFADWELSLPRITTMTAQQQGVSGWVVNSINKLARCSQFATPPVCAWN